MLNIQIQALKQTILTASQETFSSLLFFQDCIQLFINKSTLCKDSNVYFTLHTPICTVYYSVFQAYKTIRIHKKILIFYLCMKMFSENLITLRTIKYYFIMMAI